MRFSLLAFPLVVLGVAGCIDVHTHPAPQQPQTTVVTPAPAPAPAPPPPVYTAPGTSATVVTQP
jgi:hypothetical protein